MFTDCICVLFMHMESTNAHIRHTWVLSAPEPLGSQGELTVYPWSVRPPFSKIFSSESTGPIKAKFHVEPPLAGGTKVCINGPGHMPKIAAMPIYG